MYAHTFTHLSQSVNNHFLGPPCGPMVGTSPSSAGGVGSTPGQGVKIPHTLGPKNQNTKQRQYCNKFNRDFKNGPHQKINRNGSRKKKKIKTKLST